MCPLYAPTGLDSQATGARPDLPADSEEVRRLAPHALFGQNTWVVPAVADNGKFQTLALVQAAGGHVVVGNTGASSPAQDAFASYRAFLGDKTAGGASPRISGTIDRFAYAAGRAWFTLRGRRGVYTIVDPDGPDVLLARPGDPVSFETTADENGGRLVRGFTDAALAR
jgi:hypothetical protein